MADSKQCSQSAQCRGPPPQLKQGILWLFPCTAWNNCPCSWNKSTWGKAIRGSWCYRLLVTCSMLVSYLLPAYGISLLKPCPRGCCWKGRTCESWTGIPSGSIIANLIVLAKCLVLLCISQCFRSAGLRGVWCIVLRCRMVSRCRRLLVEEDSQFVHFRVPVYPRWLVAWWFEFKVQYVRYLSPVCRFLQGMHHLGLLYCYGIFL